MSVKPAMWILDAWSFLEYYFVEMLAENVYLGGGNIGYV